MLNRPQASSQRDDFKVSRFVAVVIRKLPSAQNKIYFGAWVSIINDEGTEHRYRIVGTDEFDSAENYISIDAPLARAFVGKLVRDEIIIQLPSGTQDWTITKIEYSDNNESGYL